MTPLIDVEGLTYSYHRGRPVLRSVSFQLHASERLGIAGGNGAGKTTLLWCLLGLLRAEGSVRLFGRPVSRAVWSKVGVVFQNPEDQLFMPSILEDVALPLLNRGVSRPEARRMALEALRKMGLEDVADRSASELSLGQRKCAALAAALAPSPELLVLDEPTAELDRPSTRRLADSLLQTQTACVIASHDLGFLEKVAHRLALLAEGELFACGPVSEILRERRLLERAGVV